MSHIRRIFKIYALFEQAFGAYKIHIVILAVVGFLSGIVEGVGVNSLIPLFSLVTGESIGTADFITQALKGAFLFFNIDFTIKYLLIFISILFIFKAVVLLIGTYIQVHITSENEKRTRDILFHTILRTNWPFLLGQKMGHLEKILSSEVKIMSAMLRSLSGAILVITGLLMYILVAINISWQIALLTGILGVFVLAVFKPLMSMLKKNTIETLSMNKEVAHFINQNMFGVKTLKAMMATEAIASMGKALFNTLQKLRIKNEFWGSVPANITQSIGIIFILIVFAFSYKTTTFSIAAFAAIVYLIQRIFTYTQQLQSHMNRMYSETPYIESVLRNKKDILLHQEKDEGREQFVFKDSLVFENVSFSYTAERKTLSDISLEIKKGEFVGLVGPSGGGKTTIVDLTLRLLEPTSGVLSIDGVNIHRIRLDELRKNIGYVSQDIYLVNDTIENNIKFYDPEVTKEDIIRTAKIAYIYETIENLPNGFQTIIGERGLMLSVGQRQRIVIARVLARNPKLLLLDEATSALDNESEQCIQKAVENLKGKITVLVIAHRLGTVMNCDRLYALEGGKIIEKGAPRELLRDEKSYFYQMYTIRE